MRVHLTCRLCGVTFADKPSRATKRTYCSRACKESDPDRRRPLADRFWSKVTKAGPLPAACPDLGVCWERSGYRQSSGHVQLGSGGNDSQALYAHRVAWDLADGKPAPSGFDVCHACDNPPCVRNDTRGGFVIDGIEYPRWGHLYLAPHAINVKDMAIKARSTKGRKADPSTVLRGEAHYKARLTETDVREIRAAFDRGEPKQDIAARFGIHRTHVTSIVARKIWRHVA